MTSPGDQSYYQTFTTCDRDRHQRRITPRGEFGEQRRKVPLSVLDDPGPDHLPAVIDEAGPVLSRTPIHPQNIR